MKEKKCNTCERVLSLDDFPVHQKMADKHLNKCKECIAIYHSGYYQENKETNSARGKKWRIENKERDRDNHAAWRANNPEKVRAARQRADAKYRKTEKHEAKVQRRRKLEKDTKKGFVSLRNVLERDGMNCGICLKLIEDKSQLVFDHIIPLARGGKHVEDNLQPAHRSCNSWKWNRLPEELIDLTPPLPGQDDEWKIRREEKASELRSVAMKKIWQEDQTERKNNLSKAMMGNTNGRFTKGIKKGPMAEDVKQKLSAANKFRILKPGIDNNKIAELYKSGLSCTKIGKELKIDKLTVKKRLMMMGLIKS